MEKKPKIPDKNHCKNLLNQIEDFIKNLALILQL
jgi:hypothetical protein